MSIEESVSEDTLAHYAMQIAAGLAANPSPDVVNMRNDRLACLSVEIAQQVIRCARAASRAIPPRKPQP